MLGERDLGIDLARGVHIASVRYPAQQLIRVCELPTDQISAFRATHGRPQYVPHDQPDSQVAAYVIATGSSRPTTVDEWSFFN